MVRGIRSGARLGHIAAIASLILQGKKVLYWTDSSEKECLFWWDVAEFIYNLQRDGHL